MVAIIASKSLAVDAGKRFSSGDWGDQKMDRPDDFSVALLVDSLLILSASTTPFCAPSAALDAPPAGPWFVTDADNGLLAGIASPAASLGQFSPLVIHGPEASGKSELARVIAEIYLASHGRKKKSSPPQKLVTTKFGELDKRVRHAAVVGGIAELNEQWQTLPVWLLEDCHRFNGSSIVEQFLVRLLDDRSERGHLTIVCGRSAPWDGTGCSPRLRSRFSTGLSLPLQLPSPAARLRILSWTASSLGLTWDIDALKMACRSQVCVRKWIDFLKSVAQREPHDSAIRCKALKPVLDVASRSTSRDARIILNGVARQFGIEVSELTGPSRRQSYVKARGVAICLLRDLGRMKWQSIAEWTGRRDHSTVLHAYTKTRKSFLGDPLLAESFHRLHRNLSEKLAGAT